MLGLINMNDYTKIIHPLTSPIEFLIKDHGSHRWRLNYGNITSISISKDRIAVGFFIKSTEIDRWHGDYFVLELLDSEDRLICFEKVKKEDKLIYTGKFGLCID